MSNVTQNHRNHRAATVWKPQARLAAIWLAFLSMIFAAIAAPVNYHSYAGAKHRQLVEAVMQGKDHVAGVPAIVLIPSAIALGIALLCALAVTALSGDDKYYEVTGTAIVGAAMFTVFFTAMITGLTTMSVPTHLADPGDDYRTHDRMAEVGATGKTRRLIITKKNVLDWPRIASIKNGSCEFLVPIHDEGVVVNHSIRVCRKDPADHSVRAYSFARSASDHPLPDKPVAAKAA